MNAQRTAKLFLVLSVATLFYRNGVVWLVRPFEIFVLLAGIFFVIDLTQKKEGLSDIRKVFSPWAKVFVFFFLFSIVGTVNGYRIYGFADPVRTFGGFFYIGINFLAFFLFLHYGRNHTFRGAVVTAFYSPLLFAPFIVLPQLVEGTAWLSDGIHFRGTHPDSVTFAFLAFIALVVAGSAFIHAERRMKKTLYWFMGAAVFSLVIWTGSRMALFATFAAFLWIARYLYTVKYRDERFPKKAGMLAAFSALALFSAVLSFSILPHEAKIMALDRLYPAVSNYLPSSRTFSGISLKATFAKVRRSPIPSLPYQSRSELWEKSFDAALRHPLGLGVEYFRSARIVFQGDKPTHSHNTLLQAILTGGIGLLVVCLFIAWKIVKMLAAAKKDGEWLALSTIMIGSMLFSLANEFLFTAPWIWVAAGLVMTLPQATPEATPRPRGQSNTATAPPGSPPLLSR